MIESIAPRAGRPKYKGGGDLSADPPAAPTAGNGGDRDVVDGVDLQYACIAPRSITAPTADCATDADFATNPLCTPEKKQPYFKAYPSLRELRVLHDLGPSAVVASICNDTYAPAIQGLVDKVHAALNAGCFKSILASDPQGRVDCLMLESFASNVVSGATRCESIGPGYCTPGAQPCRVPGSSLPPSDPATAASQLNLPITVTAPNGTTYTQPCSAHSDGTNVWVGGDSIECGSINHLLCEVRQIGDDAQCKTDPSYVLAPGDPRSGWCYTSDPAVVSPSCIKIGAPGTIRFEGVEPKDGSESFTPCGQLAVPTCK
jgi:hypothetical protein